MKKLKKVIPFILLVALVGCNGGSKKDDLILPDGGDLVVNKVEEGLIYLNITSIGLYNGEAGKLIADSNVEYGVILDDLQVGDELPKSEMTSSTKDVVFYNWCYYVSGGQLTYTTTVVADVVLYQAVYEYTGNYKPTEDSSSTEASDSTNVSSDISSDITSDSTDSTGSEDSSESGDEDLFTYTFIDAGWWNTAAAESWVYLWNSENPDTDFKLAWPGECMSYVTDSWDPITGTNVWTFEVDLNKYDRAVISRRSAEGGENDWNSQTSDIELSKAFNTITLDSTPAWYSDGNYATVTTSFEA